MNWFRKLLGKGAASTQASGATQVSGKNPRHVDLRQGTAEFEAFIANNAIDMPDQLAHGAQHLANLLAFDPERPEWLALAERYAIAGGADPEAVLLPPAGELYAATEALRAWLWARAGRMEEALDRLLQAQGARPQTDYISTWALDWVEPAGRLESLTPALQLRVLGQAISGAPEFADALMPRRQQLKRWAAVADRLIPSDEMREQWPLLHIGIHRRAGNFEAALALAGPEDGDDWHRQMGRGSVLAKMHRYEEADRAYRRAAAIDPEPVSTALDGGDTALDAALWERAIAWYDHALTQATGNDWAVSSRLYALWKLSGEAAHYNAMVELAKAGNDRAYALWFRAAAHMPEPADATANVIWQWRERLLEPGCPADEFDGPMKITVSFIEAPSNLLAAQLELRGHGRNNGALSVTNTAIPSPDPRHNVTSIAYPLWRYEGDVALPAVQRPPESVVQDIADLAATPYSPGRNWAETSPFGYELTEERALQIFATMVHPPAIPDGRATDLPAIQWLPRVQLTALQVIAQMPGAWENSLRRELLLSALLGPSDWATTAAIRALAWTARRWPATGYDIHQHFTLLEQAIPRKGHCTWAATLFEEWRRLPLLWDDERAKLAAKAKAFQEE